MPYSKISHFICASLTTLWLTPTVAAELDPSFGLGGFTLSDLDRQRFTNDRANDIAVQPDGHILLAGAAISAVDDADQDMLVMRLRPDGSPDPGFGPVAPGAQVFAFNYGGEGRDVATAVGQQSAGRIIVAGTVDWAADDRDCMVIGLTPDGRLDPTFGLGGFAHIWLDVGGTGADECADLAILGDDSIVLAGQADTGARGLDVAVVKLTPDGQRDLSFGVGGKLTLDLALEDDKAQAVVFEPDGQRIVIAGTTGFEDTDYFAIRLLPDGRLDPSFGGGVVRADGLVGRPDELGDLTRLADGRYVLAGRSAYGALDWDLTAVRLLTDGRLDPSFGSAGRAHVYLDLGGIEEHTYSVIELPDRGLVLAGAADSDDGRLATAVRLSPDGLRAPRFFGGALAIEFEDMHPLPSTQAFYAMAMQPDGQLLLAGESTRSNPYDIDMVTARVDPQPDPLAHRVEWQWPAPAGEQIMTTPVVGNLNDDTQDGAIDFQDIPDIVFTTYQDPHYEGAGRLRALDGAHQQEMWAIDMVDGDPIAGTGGVAIADIDGDEAPEILVQGLSGDLLAVDHQGRPLWRCPAGPQAPGAVGYSAPSIADIDGDGRAEILLGNLVCDHQGARIEQTDLPTGRTGFLANIDDPADPMLAAPEIIDAAGVAEVGGGVRWSRVACRGPRCRLAGHPAIAQLDPPGPNSAANPHVRSLELITVSSGRVQAFNADGSNRWTAPLMGGTAGGPPTVADLDGDGYPEIGVASGTTFGVYDRNGWFLWGAPVHDPSTGGAAAMSADLDGDGRIEVLVADERDLWVFDGPTGAVVMHEPRHQSRTLHEYPVVADVDRDGQQEIVLASNGRKAGDFDGITVLGSASNGWAPGRPVWHQHAYRPCAIHDNLAVPARPACGPSPAAHTFR